MSRITTVIITGMCLLTGCAGYIRPEQKVGDLTIGQSWPEQGVFAASQNSAGAIFGKICLKDYPGCTWVLLQTSEPSCTVGRAYSAVLTVDGSVVKTDVTCGPPSRGRPRYFFRDFAAVAKKVKSAKSVTVAILKPDGQFNSHVFQTNEIDAAMVILDNMTIGFTPTKLSPIVGNQPAL